MSINVGDVCAVLTECLDAGDTKTKTFKVQASGVLLSLYVQSLTGTLDVNVYTVTKSGEEKLIDTFPQISAPTTELILRKQVEVHDHLRVEVITSGAAKYDIRAKGVEASLASVEVRGADTWSVDNTTVTSTPAVLISSDLEDRNGLMIRNANFTGVEILRVAESEAKLLAGTYASILPGEALQPDIRAGNEVWAESSGADIRVEITEIS